MAAPAAPEIDKAELKKLLMRSKKEPVSCAIGMSKGAGTALIMLDKIKQPRAISKELEKKHGEVASPRWGTAFVDVDVDPKLVILTINKAAPGFARKMRKTLKGTGFTKIEIHLEDGTVHEAAGEDDDEEQEDRAAAPGGSPPAATAAARPDGAVADVAAEPPPQQSADGAPAAPASDAPPDTAGLTKRLTDLVRSMIPLIAADPSRQSELKALATQAQAALKASDPGAQALIDQLDSAVNAGPAPAGGAASAPQGAGPADKAGQTALTTAPAAWKNALTTIATDLEQLKNVVRQEFKSEPPEVVADIEKNLARIDAVVGRFDSTLADLLEQAATAENGAARTAILGKARSVVADHIKYVASEPLIGLIDDNPFGVSPGIKKRLAAVLTEVTAAVR